MKIKQEEKMRAIELRKKGFPVKGIAKCLSVSVGSVSCWVRGITLTTEQKNARLCRVTNGQLLAIESHSRKSAIRRQQWQADGKQMAKEKDKDFVSGCMLYWAEGDKAGDVVRLANSDPNLAGFFVRWMRRHFLASDSQFSVSIHCYTSTCSFDDIWEFWQEKLQLPPERFRKPRIDKRPTSSSGKKIGKCPYGTVHIHAGGVEIAQKIFGAIKEIACFDNGEWLQPRRQNKHK